MATKNWTAFEAARELLNPKNIKSESVIEIGSKYPLFAKMVLTDGTQSLVHILAALPKVTARMVEAGLRDGDGSSNEKEEKNEIKSDVKKPGRPSEKSKATEKKEDENPYAGKSARELYDLCKERGLKVKMKQPASVYIKMLIEDDQDAQDPEDLGAEDDWGDEEEEKTVKKKPGRPASSKKKEEPEDADEEEDDWEI